eukprot:TRINITY_DN12769_c4_g1_i1.p1 TRINITY_DN12769_c4_g1~~TRINITY_DN12769_c4_g1_i1.p1  ORF type:complete len:670 (-),score=79.50 TRINITY_DN12769_c4_g1_i1:116-2125(-)
MTSAASRGGPASRRQRHSSPLLESAERGPPVPPLYLQSRHEGGDGRPSPRTPLSPRAEPLNTPRASPQNNTSGDPTLKTSPRFGEDENFGVQNTPDYIRTSPSIPNSGKRESLVSSGGPGSARSRSASTVREMRENPLLANRKSPQVRKSARSSTPRANDISSGSVGGSAAQGSPSPPRTQQGQGANTSCRDSVSSGSSGSSRDSESSRYNSGPSLLGGTAGLAGHSSSATSLTPYCSTSDLHSSLVPAIQVHRAHHQESEMREDSHQRNSIQGSMSDSRNMSTSAASVGGFHPRSSYGRSSFGTEDAHQVDQDGADFVMDQLTEQAYDKMFPVWRQLSGNVATPQSWETDPAPSVQVATGGDKSSPAPMRGSGNGLTPSPHTPPHLGTGAVSPHDSRLSPQPVVTNDLPMDSKLGTSGFVPQPSAEETSDLLSRLSKIESFLWQRTDNEEVVQLRRRLQTVEDEMQGVKNDLRDVKAELFQANLQIRKLQRQGGTAGNPSGGSIGHLVEETPRETHRVVQEMSVEPVSVDTQVFGAQPVATSGHTSTVVLPLTSSPRKSTRPPLGPQSVATPPVPASSLFGSGAALSARGGPSPSSASGSFGQSGMCYSPSSFSPQTQSFSSLAATTLPQSARVHRPAARTFGTGIVRVQAPSPTIGSSQPWQQMPST